MVSDVGGWESAHLRELRAELERDPALVEPTLAATSGTHRDDRDESATAREVRE